MDIKCPHCGAEYEVEKKDMYHYTTCEVCGKGFVIGATTSLFASDSHKNDENPPLAKSGNKIGVRKQGTASSCVRNIPHRFANLANTDSRAKSQTRKSGLNKVVTILCVVFGALIVAGVVTYGAYLYFGDAPRLNRGIAHYENMAYSKAYKLLLSLAKKGYAKAQLIVGDCYANGQGVFMDTEEAVKWYRAAADQELPEAQHRMFVSCRDGVGIERNQENAAKWCRKSAEAGFEEAMFDMGMLYVNGTGVEQNAKSAFKWFRKGAERGFPPSLYQFGQCYKVGYGVEKDEDEAQKWQGQAVAAWRASANGGDTGAMVRLAKLYEEGDVVELDKEEAVKWYRKGAELGNEIAQYELATCYHNGEGVAEDQEESAKWMLKAAEKGTDRGVQWAMGRYYQEGWGVEKNPTEAVKWFERSAKKGFSMAKYYLAMCYLKGEGVQKDEVKSEQLLEEAADAGDEDAKTELNRIRDERASEERRIAQEKAEKRGKIDVMEEVESEIIERKNRINSILKGKLGGDWEAFDAGKITQTDASVSVKAEEPLKKISETFSESDLLGELDEALRELRAESERLEARLAEIAKVKDVYDAKELESRKETCVPCGGKGTIECVRCKGKGEVIVKETKPCPICAEGYDDDDDFASSGSGRKGYVRTEVDCSNCRGSGEIAKRPQCQFCGGKGKRRIESPGRLPSIVRCDNCGGSGRGEEYSQSCPKCRGDGKVEVWRPCSRCGGKGMVSSGSKMTCSVCEGKGKFQCERCGGRGFTYRPKEGAVNAEHNIKSNLKMDNDVAKHLRGAEQGDAEAQFQLGLCYAKGIGVEKNLEEMMKWYRKSAEQGYAKAQGVLGLCYEHGSGIEKDEREAIRWFRKAAEQGDAFACGELGYCYAKGIGVEKDETESSKWYRKMEECSDGKK